MIDNTDFNPIVKAISADDEDVQSNTFRTRRKSQEDIDFSLDDVEDESSPKQKCFICKKVNYGVF